MDNCCYNRPFDDQNQDRIHYESEAVLSIIRQCERGEHILIGSSVLKMEINEIYDSVRRNKVYELYSMVDEEIVYSDMIEERAKLIRGQANIRNMDSWHLISAEFGKADVFISTDDKLIKASKNTDLKVKVVNPVVFLVEAMEDE